MSGRVSDGLFVSAGGALRRLPCFIGSEIIGSDCGLKTAVQQISRRWITAAAAVTAVPLMMMARYLVLLQCFISVRLANIKS